MRAASTLLALTCGSAALAPTPRFNDESSYLVERLLEEDSEYSYSYSPAAAPSIASTTAAPTQAESTAAPTPAPSPRLRTATPTVAPTHNATGSSNATAAPTPRPTLPPVLPPPPPPPTTAPTADGGHGHDDDNMSPVTIAIIIAAVAALCYFGREHVCAIREAMCGNDPEECALGFSEECCPECLSDRIAARTARKRRNSLAVELRDMASSALSTAGGNRRRSHHGNAYGRVGEGDSMADDYDGLASDSESGSDFGGDAVRGVSPPESPLGDWGTQSGAARETYREQQIGGSMTF